MTRCSLQAFPLDIDSSYMTVVTVVASISYKTDEYEGCKNFMAGNAAETTGDRTWPQNSKHTEQATLTKLQCICI